MPTDPSRRDFLRRTASLVAVAGVAPFLGACESCFERIRSRPIRRSLATLAPNDPIIETYRDAVAQMKALASTDRRSWQAQAQIHFDHCPHGNWYFLPWHRAYLHYFELICRDLTGNEDFALPYWDWTVDASVPAPFWGDSSNPLFQSGRTATSSSVANSLLVGRPVIDDILNEIDFQVFGSGASTGQRQRTTTGRLEGTPHNYVHGFVGGVMGSYMSPLDPIFWMHHNMVECLWVEWNLVRKNANPNDAQWTAFQFAGNFCDTSGNLVDISVGPTILMPLLSYQFDGECGGPGGPGRLQAVLADSAALRTFLERGGGPRIETVRTFPTQRGFRVTARSPVSEAIEIPGEAIDAVVQRDGMERLLLRIAAIRAPRSSSFFVRVFVNHDRATPETPADDPHYAGSFAFFTDPEHQADAAAGAGAYTVDLTATMRQLSRAGEVLTPLRLDLVAVPMGGDGGTDDVLSVRQLQLELARILPSQDEGTNDGGTRSPTRGDTVR